MTATATAPDRTVGSPPALAAGRRGRRGNRARARAWSSWLVVLPFAAFVGLFLAWPLGNVMYHAFTPGDGGFTLSSMRRAVTGPYRASFMLSLKLSGITALLGTVIGTALALALRGVTRPRWFRAAVDGWTAVASQLGGLPLAFAFVATLGTQGLVSRLFREAGFDLQRNGFVITEFSGWVLVYLYFQIPLMFLVMSPAVEGIKVTWEEAAASIGAARWQFWRHVGLPVLLPSLLAGYVLLFVNAFSAYATVYSLSTGAGQLVPLQIRFVLQGNVISGEQDLGYALVTWTVLLLIAALVTITLLQRRVGRWSAR